MPATTRDWISVQTAKSINEIKARYKVNKFEDQRRKKKEMHHFRCKLFPRVRGHCQFQVRWNEQSEQVWESGVHNHGPEATPLFDYAKLKWRYLTKTHSQLSIRKQFSVHLNQARGSIIYFKCRNMVREKCPYLLRWHSQSGGELFEANAHNHEKLPAVKMKLYEKWHLLNVKSIHMLREIYRRYSLKRCTRTKGYNNYCCGQCDGKECFFRFRWSSKNGKISTFWNKKKLCQRRKKENGRSIQANETNVFEPQKEIGLNENTASIPTPEPEVQIIGEFNRDHKCIPLPPMKQETAEKEKENERVQEQPTTETAAAAGEGRRPLRIRNRVLSPLLAIEELQAEAACSQPSCGRSRLNWPVKKEEPNDVEELEAAGVEDAIGKGRKEAADQAPTKMLLRERKRQPNYRWK